MTREEVDAQNAQEPESNYAPIVGEARERLAYLIAKAEARLDRKAAAEQ